MVNDKSTNTIKIAYPFLNIVELSSTPHSLAKTKREGVSMSSKFKSTPVPLDTARGNGADIYNWNPEDATFWHKAGYATARRNLWVSIPSLMAGFAVWLYWSTISVQMLNLGFSFSKSELFTLVAIAGFSGATLRIPSSFFIRPFGGRNTIVFTTALLIIPAIGTGFALQDKNTPLWLFQLLALLSGIGGGNFASSMSNITFFFPKKKQGLALGLNAGLGNFGITAMQIITPFVMTFSIVGGEPMTLENTSGTAIGKIASGSQSYIQNASFIWLFLLIPLIFLGWFRLNNLRVAHVSPNPPNLLITCLSISTMLLIGLVISSIGLWLLLPEFFNGYGWSLPKEIVLMLTIVVTVLILKTVPGKIGKSLTHQYEIFNNPNTWVLSLIYTMTFGSFIGFAASFPLIIKVIFGYQHLNVNGILTHSTVNPNGPSALMYAWMGPFIGALIRPIGGWIADKVGGSIITQICTVVMFISVLSIWYYLTLAYQSETPENYFVPFFIFFLMLFSAIGIANGSTFRTIATIFNKEQTGPVLGWVSAIAAYGAFYIPQTFAEQIDLSTPGDALIFFSIFYGICLIINWFYYLRRNSEYYNP